MLTANWMSGVPRHPNDEIVIPPGLEIVRGPARSMWADIPLPSQLDRINRAWDEGIRRCWYAIEVLEGPLDIEDQIEPVENELLDSFEFSIRTSNCLQRGFVEDNPGEREGYATLAWLLTKSAPQLLRIYNFGRRSLNEVKEALAQRGLHLRKD